MLWLTGAILAAALGGCPLRLPLGAALMPPGPLQDGKPVLMGNLAHKRLAIAMGAHCMQKRLLADHIADADRHCRPVEI